MLYGGTPLEVSSFQGVLIRGVPAVLFIEVSSFQGVLIRGVPAVLFIEVSSFQGVLIRGWCYMTYHYCCFSHSDAMVDKARVEEAEARVFDLQHAV